MIMRLNEHFNMRSGAHTLHVIVRIRYPYMDNISLSAQV